MSPAHEHRAVRSRREVLDDGTVRVVEHCACGMVQVTDATPDGRTHVTGWAMPGRRS